MSFYLPAAARYNAPCENQPTVCAVKRPQLREWRESNRDRVNAQNRAYTQRNPEDRARSTAEWRKRNKIKRRAHRMVEYAITKARLVRLPCDSCGNPKSQAHHDDYSKPLEVKWKCAACHGKEHRRGA